MENKCSNYFSIFLFQTFKPIAVAEYPKNPNTISVEIPNIENTTATQNALRDASLFNSNFPFGARVSYVNFRVR